MADAIDTDGSEPEWDDGEGAESTITMSAPTFDSAIPSPISDSPPPPPPPPPQAQPQPITPVLVPRTKMPMTAPVPFTPGPVAAAIPVPRQRPASSPVLPTPIGGLTPGPAVPRSGGGVPAQAPGRPGPQVGPSPASPPRPGAARRVPPATASTPVMNPPPGSGVGQKRDAGSGPKAGEALFGVDSDLSKAAFSAVGGPSQARAMPPGPPRLSSPDGDDEPETRAVPREELGLVRTPPSGPAVLTDAADEEEATRAVPREELHRLQETHVVIGNDGVGDDATVAVAPGENTASSLQGLVQNFQGPGQFQPPPSQGGWNEPYAAWAPPDSRPFGMDSSRGRPPEPVPMPPSNPMPPMSNPYPSMSSMPSIPPMAGQLPPSGHLPLVPHMGQVNHVNQGAPMHRHPAGQAPGGDRIKLSTPVVVGVVAVCVVCLGIFITGLVLFWTTKF